MGRFTAVKEAAGIYLSRVLMRCFYIFPVDKKKIFFTSYEGKQFSCNPKCVYLELKKDGRGKLKFVYEYNSGELPEELRENVRVVSHNSFAYFKEMLTSRVIVTNSGITAKIPLRRSQIMINTWHGGGAYKRVGNDIPEEINGSGRKYTEISQRQTTCFLTSSRRFSEVSHTSFGMPFEKMIPTGMPRNDIFWKEDSGDLSEKIRKRYGLARETRLVLYAPTYRGKAHGNDGFSQERLDEGMLLEALGDRFGGVWRMLYRGHYFQESGHSTQRCTDVSDYPDMQELLAVADVLITDYSSTVWDFSFTGRPGFLFVPDRKEYEKERSLYTPLEQWPYENAVTNEALAARIREYAPEEQKARCLKHHEDFGSYENGTATKQAAQLVRSFL